MAAALLAAALALSMTAGCTQAPPDKVVDQLLRLRASRTTDAKAYARFMLNPATASALATDSARRAPGSTPTPAWRPPQVTTQTVDTAEVRVQWLPDAQHPGWPTESVFELQLTSTGWKVEGLLSGPPGSGAAP